MRRYSILIHVTQAAQHENLHELLASLSEQTFTNFEVIVVEECEGDACGVVSLWFKDRLTIKYFNKKEAGEGYTRNFAFEKASGDYFILLDPSTVLPRDYLSHVENHLQKAYLDSFIAPVIPFKHMNAKEQAIFYSFNHYSVDVWYDRDKRDVLPFYFGNVNMGFSKEVFDKTKGYILSDVGEEMEFWVRIRKNGFSEGVIKEALVFHKGIKNYKELFRGMKLLGRARINVFRFFSEELKSTHFVPLFFLFFLSIMLLCFFLNRTVFGLLLIVLGGFSIAAFIDMLTRKKKMDIAIFSLAALYVQWIGYSLGFISELYKELSGTKKRV